MTNQKAQDDSIKATMEKYPELKERVGSTPSALEVIEELRRLLEEKDRKIMQESEPTVIMSAQVPVSLRTRVQEIAKAHENLSMKRIIVDSLNDYIDAHPELVPDGNDRKDDQKEKSSDQQKQRWRS